MIEYKRGDGTSSSTAHLKDRLGAHVAKLPDSDRKVLYLRYAERRTVEEIATDTGFKPLEVEKVLIRARALMSSTHSRPAK